MDNQMFHNPLKEDFTFRWDKVPYTIKAGETKEFQQGYLARHGAKHLTDYIILHPAFWEELGLKRDDRGDKRNNEGQLVNEPDLTKGREEILDIIFCREKKVELKESDIKAREEKLKKLEQAQETPNKEFQDLQNFK